MSRINFHFRQQLEYHSVFELSTELKNPQKLSSFIEELSDPQWLKDHPALCLKALNVIPKTHLSSLQLALILEVITTRKIFQPLIVETQKTFERSCRFGDERLAEILILGGMPKDKLIDGQSPLSMAIQNRCSQVALTLLNNGASPNLPNKWGKYPLHQAALNGEISITQMLIKYNANLNVVDAGMQTPLYAACMKGYKLIAELLLDNGAFPNVTKKDNKLLFFACEDGHLTLAQKLLQKGANPHFAEEYGDTPFDMAKLNVVLKPILPQLKQHDNRFSQEVYSRKLLAHLYSVNGNSRLLDADIKLEGWMTDRAQKVLCVSTNEFYDKIIKSWDSSSGYWNKTVDLLSAYPAIGKIDKSTLQGIFAQASEIFAECNIDDLTSDKIEESLSIYKLMACYGSWGGHIIAFATDGIEIGRCNKGDGCGDSSGIVLHHITKPKNLPGFINDFKNNKQARKSLFQHHIYGTLGLRNRQYIQQEEQDVGNCAIASANSLEVLVLYKLFKHLIGKDAAKALAKVLKKERVGLFRHAQLGHYLKKHSPGGSLSHIEPDYLMLGKIYQKSTSRRDEDIQRMRKIIEFGQALNMDISTMPGLELISG